MELKTLYRNLNAMKMTPVSRNEKIIKPCIRKIIILVRPNVYDKSILVYIIKISFKFNYN